MSSKPSPYDSSPEIQTSVTTGVVLKSEISSSAERRHGTIVILTGRQSGTIHLLDDEPCSIGRGRGNRIWVADEGMSRNHATILCHGDGFYVRDEDSRNGTYVNGERLETEHKLDNGDRITVGRGVTLKFTLEDPLERAASRQTLELSINVP